LRLHGGRIAGLTTASTELLSVNFAHSVFDFFPMASLELDPLSGNYRIRFRYHGQPYKRSLHTKKR